MINWKKKSCILKLLILFSGIFLFQSRLQSQDSSKALNIKLPRHYFNTIILIDGYSRPASKLIDTSELLSRRLKSYGVKQFNMSFCTPLITKSENVDSATIRNTHILLTGNYTLLQPIFEGISQHNLIKLGLGVRYIFNSGKKGVWFIDASPFITKDITYNSKSYFRIASTIIYSHNPSDVFNWRLGITKSFMWGNRFYWPFIGIRIGKLDKMNLSIQFPKSISFNVPVNSKFILSLYTRPQGGLFNFSNRDSLYFKKTDAVFNFTRYEINTGLRVDVRVNKNFNFYLASGISSKNNITFYSETTNGRRSRSPYRKYFYSQEIPSTLFFNLGCVLKFGKTRSYYNNRNLYDAMDLNNVEDINGNAQIPITPKTKKIDANLESVRDLLDYSDF